MRATLQTLRTEKPLFGMKTSPMAFLPIGTTQERPLLLFGNTAVLQQTQINWLVQELL